MFYQRLMLDLLDNCVESVFWISGVLHNSCAAVRIEKSIGTLHDISIPFLPVCLMVTSVGILHTIVELILGWSVKIVWNDMRLFLVMSRFAVFNLVLLLLLVFFMVGSMYAVCRRCGSYTNN